MESLMPLIIIIIISKTVIFKPLRTLEFSFLWILKKKYFFTEQGRQPCFHPLISLTWK
jgi:hypothetical protein